MCVQLKHVVTTTGNIYFNIVPAPQWGEWGVGQHLLVQTVCVPMLLLQTDILLCKYFSSITEPYVQNVNDTESAARRLEKRHPTSLFYTHTIFVT